MPARAADLRQIVDEAGRRDQRRLSEIQSGVADPRVKIIGTAPHVVRTCPCPH